MKRKVKSEWFSFAIGALVVLGLATLIPAPQQKVNLMGDFTLCPFVPMSTTILWVAAVGVIIVKDWKREQREKQQEQQEQLERQRQRYR